MKAAAQSINPADEALIKSVAEGDREAFRLLSERYMGMIYAIAFRMYPSRADAEDLTQESLLRLWDKAAQWSPDGGAVVKSWIYRMVYNLCIDHKRKDKRRRTQGLGTDLMADEQTDKAIRDKQCACLVAAAIEDLPRRQRAALTLCHYQELSNADAARIMGVSVKALESLLVRARRTLKDKLSPYKGGF